MNYFYTLVFSFKLQVSKSTTMRHYSNVTFQAIKEAFPFEVKAASVGSRTWKSKETDYYTCQP